MANGRFVILWHEMPAGSARRSHWDLMLETSPSAPLRTWALEDEPRLGARITAQPLADHRREYLDYEGPLTQNRGHVTQWDRGTYRMSSQAEQQCEVELNGSRLNCRLRIESADNQTAVLSFSERSATASLE